MYDATLHEFSLYNLCVCVLYLVRVGGYTVPNGSDLSRVNTVAPHLQAFSSWEWMKYTC